MKNINWSQLERNSESKELGFEQFCFQIAYKEYSSLGQFEYYYNTPGSEFYLTLKEDNEDYGLRAGDTIGWQAKFWRNNADEDNSPLDKKHRDELVEGFKKTIEYKPNIKKWIICTPGKFSNTAPHNVVDKLETELRKVEQDILIDYWHKDIFLAKAFKSPDFYALLFNHYFSTKFIGFEFLKHYSEKKLDRLKDKFDIDLYIENEIDNDLKYILEPEKIRERLKNLLHTAVRYIKNKDHHIDEERSDFKYLDKDYIQDVKNLMNDRCKLVIDIYNSLKTSYNPQLINDLLKTHKDKYFEIIPVLNKKLNEESYLLGEDDEAGNRDLEKHIHNSYFRFIQKVSAFLFDKENEAINVQRLLKYSFLSDIHIFGSAGYGKTNLACAICKKHLDKGIPALLILGSNIKDSLSPQDQILASLDLKNEFSFKELLFALDSLGSYKKCRIPIIIDGLNESTPTAKIWKETLPDLIYDIRNFDNIILITTLREGYVGPVFGKNIYTEVENNYKIEGFNNLNVNQAIKKYFKKYNISVKNQFDKNLFKNPLLLKIFCDANKDMKNASVTQNNIYKSIDDYVLNLISKIADTDPIRKNKAFKGIEAISLKLWDNNSRSISYPDEYISLVDGNIEVFEKSLSHAMMDEGMFFIRNFDGNDEEIQFTYDLIAGYCVAKFYLLKNKSEAEIITLLKSDGFNRITQKEQSHPLSEDILKAIIHLIPTKCEGKSLYQINDIEISTIDYISNIDILSQDSRDKKDLINFFSSMDLSDTEIDILCEKICNEIIERNSFSNIEVLYSCYLNWSNYQRDLYWNEKTRKGVWKIFDLLKNISKEKYLDTLIDQDLFHHLLFCVLLFSSTDNGIRNKATKAAVILSEKNPDLILKILSNSILLSDLYVLERIVATLCGTILRVKDRIFTNKCCEYLQEDFLPNTTTNHIVILDYIETIFEFGRHYFNYPYSPKSLLRNQKERWEKDKTYQDELAQHKYFHLEYDIFDYDFVKYNIKCLVNNNNPKLTYQSIYSSLHFRTGLHGYKKDLYKNLEKKLSEEQRYRRDDDLDSMENYLFKYLWTSYFEFIGYLRVNDIISKEHSSIFRVDDIMIDPTFPQLPAKIQLVNDCFLPLYNENVQDWVNSERNDYFENIINTIFNEEGEDTWILLDASSTQETSEAKIKQRISIYLDTFIFSSPKELKQIESDHFHTNLNGIYNIYAGELPWSLNIKDDSDSNTEIFSATDTYSFQSWDNSRSRLCDRFPFLNNEISSCLKLQFNCSDLTYYYDDEKVTKLLWTKDSRFYFIKKKYLQKYLSDNKLKAVHQKFIAKYGEFGVAYNEGQYNPSYKDIKACKLISFDHEIS